MLSSATRTDLLFTIRSQHSRDSCGAKCCRPLRGLTFFIHSFPAVTRLVLGPRLLRGLTFFFHSFPALARLVLGKMPPSATRTIQADCAVRAHALSLCCFLADGFVFDFAAFADGNF